MNVRRTTIWSSSGAASAIAARLILSEVPDTIIARCETGTEDADHNRFAADAMGWLNASVTVLRPAQFESVAEVWRRERAVSEPSPSY
ncbi:hypothetical protein ACU4GR_01570 [Methylobacterium oryzae CBMB20]